MAATTYPATGGVPQEIAAFCHWLIGAEDAPSGESPDAYDGAVGLPSARAGVDGAAAAGGGGGEPAHARWHRVVLHAADDGFSQLCRTVRREAALLAERSMPLWEAVGRADPLSKAVSRAGARLAALAASAPAGSEEARLLQHLPGGLLHELVAGYVDATRPAPAQGETERRLTAKVAELAALQKINSAINSSLDLSQVLAHTVDVVAEVMHADATTIFLYEDSGRLVLRATRGQNPAAIGQVSLALGEGITGWTAQYGRPVALADAWSDRRFAYVPALMEEPYHGWLSVPIILFRANEATSKLVGVLNIQTRAAKEFSPEDVAFAEMVAGQIAIAIENARLYGLTDERLREKVQQLEALQRVTATLVSSLHLGQVLATVARQAAMITGTDMAGIFELDEERQLLKIVAHHGLSARYLSVEVKVGEGAVGLAVAERKPIVILDAQADPRLRLSSAARWVAEEGYRSMFSVPLISRNRVLGGISVYTRDRHEFSLDQIHLLLTFANDAAIAIENARLYEEMRRGLEMTSTLLRELNHRVKNNLQMMASFLNLQMRRTKSKEAIQTLGAIHTQIASLAAAHDLLSMESTGLTTVQEIARRVGKIAEADLLPHGAGGKRIEVDTSGANVSVSSEMATLLALVLNELLCNAIEHGMAQRTTGKVVVAAREVAAEGDEPATVEIEVHDDGDGLPPGFALEQHAGLGLSIVQRLVHDQLKGSFAIQAHPNVGTLARVRVPRAAQPPTAETSPKPALERSEGPEV
jgi:GAF domain-containing protein/anti-sigma regulatory factor (Ser/Thr protein kinase)